MKAETKAFAENVTKDDALDAVENIAKRTLALIEDLRDDLRVEDLNRCSGCAGTCCTGVGSVACSCVYLDEGGDIQGAMYVYGARTIGELREAFNARIKKVRALRRGIEKQIGFATNYARRPARSDSFEKMTELL